MASNSDRQRLLRLSLRGNAAFSALSGVTFAAMSPAIAKSIGLDDPIFVFSMGLNLLGFAALLAWVASRPTLHLKTALAIVWMDVAWVVGTVPVVLSDVFNSTGTIAALCIADVVLAFAIAQYLGVRRIRRAVGGGVPGLVSDAPG